MTLDEELWAAQQAAGLLPAPQGPRYVKVLGRLRAGLPRIQKDAPALEAFISDLIPVVSKHLPTAGPALEDLLPIIEACLEDLKS